MSIVSINNMSSSNLLHPLIHADRTMKRKRYLEDLELLEENKRPKTAPPSPPLAAVMRGRSLSPPPVIPTRTPIETAPTLDVNNGIMKYPMSSPKQSPLLPVRANIELTSHEVNTLPPSNSVHTSNVFEPGYSSLTNEFKYLNQNTRYGGISNHSLDYPDTCINDDDWRLNLELWIEKNFPEKFNHLKNLLRYDKPGFELLNDAILLTELREQLDKEKHLDKRPTFTSRISKKMVMNPLYNSTMFQRRPMNEHSDDEAMAHIKSSPIAFSSDLGHRQSDHQTSPSSCESNYTYQTNQMPSSPPSTRNKYVEDLTLPSIRSQLNRPIQSFDTQLKSSKPHSPLHQTKSTTNNNNNSQQIIIESKNFIHTQNHRGPNHTYTIHHHNHHKRKCISCGSDQSPCWRPSWSTTAGQLCNSCGLRYKKTGARCISKSCGRIPAKGEWTAMKSRGKVAIVCEDGTTRIGYKCLHCGGEVEVRDRK